MERNRNKQLRKIIAVENRIISIKQIHKHGQI